MYVCACAVARSLVVSYHCLVRCALDSYVRTPHSPARAARRQGVVQLLYCTTPSRRAAPRRSHGPTPGPELHTSPTFHHGATEERKTSIQRLEGEKLVPRVLDLTIKYDSLDPVQGAVFIRLPDPVPRRLDHGVTGLIAVSRELEPGRARAAQDLPHNDGHPYTRYPIL